jgi:hypothetical protein
MGERDLDAEQRRLLGALERIDMTSELREQLESVVREWIKKQRAVDRLWDPRRHPRDPQ